MKKTLHFIHFMKQVNKAFYLLLFFLSSTIGFAQTITPTKTVTVAPGVCGALDVELKIQGSNPVARPLEVVLVIDVSGSMGDGNNPKPLSYAQDAANDFIDKMFLAANNPTGNNKVAIVTFSNNGTIRQGLTSSAGKAGLKTIINGLVANGGTNIEDGILKANQVLATATYNCSTARSMVLLTDGVANASATHGTNCTGGQQGTCIQDAIAAANAGKTVVVSGVTYNNQIFSVGLFGAINGSEQTDAQYTLNQIQSGGSFFTENAADLTGIYSQIFTQLSWVAKQIVGTPFEKETVDPNFIIGTVTSTKGTTTVTGQQIAWNIDFLNVETITLKYRLTPKPNTCGNQMVSTSRLDFQNALCVTTFQDITSPTTNVPCPIVTVANQTNVTCFGGNNGAITLNTPTGGQGPYTYKWTKNDVNFATTKDISGLTVGTYKVIATDNNNCATAILTINITQPAAALALAASSKTDATCNGASSGSVTAGAVTNSVGTVTYSWKNSSNVVVGTTASVTGLPAGTYTLTVTDSCSNQSNSVTIGQPASPLALAASSKTDASCNGASTGSVTAGAVTNSVGTVTYSWKNSSNIVVGTTATVTGLPAGTYTLTVTDSCSNKTNSVTIGQPAFPLTLAASSKTDASCYGASSGSVTAGAVTNFVGTVTYSWKNSSNVVVGTTASVTGLPTGTYTLTVTDSCSSQSNSVTIGQPSLPLALAASSKTDASCYGASSGSVTAGTVTNSVGTVTYSWKNSSNTVVGTTATVTGLPAGTYTLTVTDSCSSQSNSVTIGQPNLPLALAASSKTDASCYGASSGSVTAGAVTNFVGTVTYSWKNSSNVVVGTTASVTGLPAGTYTLTVTDSCSSQSNSVTIGQPALPLALAASSKTDASCYGASSGSVTAGTVTNSVGTVTYSWKNSSNVVVGTTASVTGLPAGTYTLTVTDSCSSQSNSVTIGQPSLPLALAASSKTDASCYGASSGSVTAGAVTNFVGTVTYSWKNSSNVVVGTTATVTGLPAGTYTLTVTDSCSSQSNSVTIGQPSLPLALATSSKTDASCYGASSGSVTAGTVTNSVGTVTYSWKNSSNIVVGTTASVTGLPAGTYTLTVTDSCSSQSNSVTIGQPALPLALAASSKTDASCYGASSGSVTAGAVTNFVGTVTYSWKNSSNAVVGTTASVTGLPTGTYTLTVTDSCSSQSNSVTIGQPSLPLALAASSKTDASCYGASSGSVTAGLVTNSVGTISYSWVNSSNTIVGTTASVTGLPTGTYTLTVTDSCSSQSNSVTIGQPSAPLSCSITQNKAVTSNGLSDGEATVSPLGGNGNYTYLWDNNETTQKAIALNAGLHSVTVTDSKGCTTTCTITISQPNVLSCSVVQDAPAKCYGDNNGIATVTAIGGNGDYTYLWDNNETTVQATALTAGLHTVTITDKLGYKTTCDVTIGQPQAALTAAINTKTDVNCKGDATGSATASATGGNGSYSYSWNTNPIQTSATANNLIAGTYIVTVTDEKGCTDTEQITITEPELALTAAIKTDTNVNCKGDATGSATASATGGTGSYSYSWNTNPIQTSATATNLIAGTYIVTVTDEKGCTDTEQITITEPELALTAAINTDTNVNCKGDATGSATASATGGTGTYSYSWNTNPVQTSATANNLIAGTYIVTVTDEKGCTDTEQITITEPELALTAAIKTDTNVNCKGDATGSATASATGGTGTYSYSWNTNPIQTSATANNLIAGTYIVTVTDEKGCTDTEQITITEPELALTAAITTDTNVNCKGDTTGSATASATGGTGTYSYSWNTNPVQTSATANNLIAGTYIVTVTDEKGCTDTEQITITEPELALTAAITTDTNVNCKGDATGSATASATGGTGTYSYSWNTNPIQTSATATNLIAGTYIVTVTDEKGCTDTEQITITEPELSLTAAIKTDTNVNCKGDATGSATASATGGTGSYSYSWNTNPVQTSATANNLIAGTYIVTVTDEKGCTDTEQITITEPELALTAAIKTDTNVNCKGDATGSATASATGGTGSYSYSWSTNPVQTSATATNLIAGTYIVTVTDEKGCTDTEQITITEPELSLTAAIKTDTNVNCKGDATGSATASATGGTGTYSYSWNTNPVQTSATANNLIAGTYIVTVTDEKGCTDTEQITITEPELSLTAAIKTDTNVNCKGDTTGSATASATGGTGSYSYSWNTNPVQTSATANNLIAGTYIVTVTDEKGCTDTEQITITEPELALTASKSQINASCGGASSGSATVVASGGTGPYTYSWNTNPEQTSATATNLLAGSYSVVITDSKGCTHTVSFEILDGDSVKPIINPLPETSTINCPAEPVFAQATATDDNGTIASLTYEDTVTPGNCAGSYTKTRTWTAKDACGNVSLPVSQTIIVQDITAPTWSTEVASLNKTIECSNAEALSSAQALFPVASDACDTDVSNIIKVSGQFVASETCSNAGTYTNTWTVKDDCGNTSDTFTQVITIQDTTAPTWSTEIASLNKTIECSNAEALASAQVLFPTATDACDTDVTNIVKVSGQFVANEGCANSGTYTNTWTVKDDCGNTSETFTQVITIQDTTAPTWSTEVASLNKTIECSNAEALSSAQALFPVASDACDTDVSNIIKVSGQFVASETCSNAGTYTNTWTVKDDCGNTSDTFTQVITIQDTTAPIFAGELPGDITVSCDAVPAAANVEASDNCNGNLPIVFSEVKSGIQNECPTNYTLTRKWTTSDCGGNTASYTQIITVRDTTPPTGTVPSNVANLQSITDIPAGSPGDITDAADNCSPTVNITVSDSHNEASGCDGNAYILTRTYTLTDCAGNKTELVRTFTVDNKVAINATVSNVTCLGAHDGSITVTNSPGSTVIIRNANNEIVGNTNLPAGTYTLTASSAVNTNNQTCTATTTVVITEPNYTIKISGQIINVDTNTPIANVPVTLIPQGTTTGPILLRITGVDGRYTFTGMPAGSYLVQVQDANLNSAHQLYPVDSSLFFTTLEDCKFQEHNFEYGKSNLPVLGDYVWYDTNGNGLQDEWYDANNDGVVTKNIPDAEGAIDFSLWEWIDFNGDGSYAGPQNAGELNAGGFGNAASPNVIVDGPNGYHKEVIVGIEGFWRDRPGTPNPYGDYNIKLVRDTNLDAVAAALGATGLVKVIPSGGTDKRKTSKPAKIAMHTVCQTTSAAGYIVTVTAEDLVHLDADFGVNCKEYRDIVANDDSAGPFPGVNHTTPNVLNVLPNDTIEGVVVTASDVIITTVTPNEFLQLNPDGSIDILPNAPAGTLTMVYQICEADQTSNCDTATVTVTIEAPTMTVTATAICVNDVPYLDYVVTPGNFTPVNGVTIAWADAANNVVTTITDLPLSGRVLWPGAVVDQAGNGIDWPGWVFQNNKWIQAPDGFEGLRPTANVTLSVNPSQTITVSYPPADPFCTARPTFAILANDDSAGPLPALTGATNVLNVYTNDTLNGDPVNPADVTLTLVTPDPTGALTLNPDGSVDVKVGTLGGTYTLTYQICENADNGNCDTAIVTVTVLNPPTPVDAVDDTYTVGCNTFGLVGNVLANDLKGNVPATLELVNFTLLSETSNESKTDPNITIDASGNVTVSSLTPPGTYTYSYRICDKLSAENCDTATITITVSPNGVTNIASKACNDDRTPIDLLALLPENTPRTGIWVDTDGSNALQGNVLNAFGLALGNYKFEYQIADENCPRSVLLNMEVNADCVVLACENIVIHNAFSPNGDGKNDVFVIDNIDQTTCYPENTVEIYNRWGILVFETTNYNNTTNAFDGTSRGRTTVKQSDGLPTGTYFYVVTYKSLDGNNVVQNHKLDGYLYLSK